jgi:hypothetical protein
MHKIRGRQAAPHDDALRFKPVTVKVVEVDARRLLQAA